MKRRYIRYAKRITIPLTRECSNDCIYCGFKKSDSSLVTLKQTQAILELAKQQECTEIRLMSGANPHYIPGLKQKLEKNNVQTLAQYAYIIANMVLNYGFLPTLEIGLLTRAEMKMLSQVICNINLLLECKQDQLFKTYRLKNYYLQMLEEAGDLKISFTTGIIVGLGETQEERFQIISDIAALQKKYNHIQEFIIQGYVLNDRTKLPLQDFLPLKELVDLYKYIIKNLPGVIVQIQPHTLDFWPDIIKLGAGSIGGISEEIDYVVPRYNSEEFRELSIKIRKLGFRLQRQLPLTISFYKAGVYSKGIKSVLNEWVGKKEYKFYRK